MKIEKKSTFQHSLLRLLFGIILSGFAALLSIHFTIYSLSADRELASGQTRVQINLIHSLSEEIKGLQTLFFIWPTITNPSHLAQVHAELNDNINQIFQTIRIIEYGGPIQMELIPPDLAHQKNPSRFTTLSKNAHLNQKAINLLKLNLQKIFTDIEHLNKIITKSKAFDRTIVQEIQQTDSTLFASLYKITQTLISETKNQLGKQQIALTEKQAHYKSVEITLIITTICTIFILTWWTTKQLILSSNIQQENTIHLENEAKRHQALNAILLISMQHLPLKAQLDRALQILLKLISPFEKETTGAIFVANHKTQAFTTVVKSGLPKDLPCLVSFEKFTTCLCGKCYQSGETLLQPKGHNSECKCSEEHNIYCTPIGEHSNPLGVLMLDLASANQTQEKISFLKFVTPILAGIIRNRLYEQLLGKSELATLSIFQESAQAILLIRDREIIDWNEVAATLFKAPNLHQFHAAKSLKNILRHDTNPREINQLHHYIKNALTDGVSHGEFQLRKQDASTFSASLTFSTIPLQGEHIVYLVIQDISAREDEKKALINAKNEAEKASAAKSTFLATMSHEILTPLNAILGITALTMSHKLPSETLENIEIIHTSSQSLRALVTDILDISKIEADQFTTIKAPFSLKNITDKIRETYKEKASQQNITLLISTDPNTPNNLLGDANRLSQVLLKLTANAFKYTMQGTVEIAISCKQKSMTNCSILFSIKDTGIGIEQSNLQTIFNDFTQITESASTRYSGAGLGLTISKRIVEKMGGTIWATSTPNQGSNFYAEITFDIHQPLNKPHNSPIKLTDTTDLKNKKILVVEDSVINLKVTCQTLQSMGAIVYQAENGEEGVAAMSTDLDAVCMDVEMPIMDGIAATKMIRNNPNYDTIPIIAITAHGINDDKDRCFQAGMNDYMTKPLEPETLRQVISRNINNIPKTPNEIINYETGVAKVGGDINFFAEILQDFRTLHGQEADHLLQLFNQNEFAEIGTRAHKLKGVAGTISAATFKALTEQLEEQANAVKPDPEEIKKTIALVKTCIDEIVKEIA